MFTRLDYSSALEYSIIRRYTNIVYYYYCIFKLCVSKELESRFLVFEYQKHTLIGTTEHYIVNNKKYLGLLLSCDMCETENMIIQL